MGLATAGLTPEIDLSVGARWPGPSRPSLGLKLLWDAHTSYKVPPTEKCSLEQ